MKIPQEASYKLVYSLVQHEHLGYLIEPYIVQLTASGAFSLTHQKIHLLNADYYEKALDSKDYELLVLMEPLNPEKITQKFAPGQKIRPKEFFEKKLDEAMLQKFIRPFIDQILLECFRKMDDRYFYLYDKGNPANQAIEVGSEPAKVLFHFLRGPEDMRYFPTIRYKEQRVYFSQNGSRIILYNPCYILAENKLLWFDEDLDGKKLEPFLTKKSILVPEKSIGTYLEKIAVPLFEKHNLFCEGIRVETEMHKASPVLRLEESIDGQPGFILSFRYDDKLFNYHSSRKVSVALSTENGAYVLRRIKRSNEWEKQKLQNILDLGLKQVEASLFRVGPREAGLALYLDWLREHSEVLEKAGFSIEQNTGKSPYHLGKAVLDVDVYEQADWFDLKVKVLFGEYEIPFVQLRKYILRGQKEFELPNGEIAIIPEEWFDKIGGMIAISESRDQVRVKKFQFSQLKHLLESRTIVARLDELRKFETIHEQKDPSGFTGKLRPYQKAGYDWFGFLQQYRFGGCLADDMGLGKTVQTLALLANEKEKATSSSTLVEAEILPTAGIAVQNVVPAQTGSQLDLFSATNDTGTSRKVQISSIQNRPVNLLIVPASLMYNWEQEAARFAPKLRTYIHQGISRISDPVLLDRYDLIISTYGTVRNDIEMLKQKAFHYIILDESQTIKNPHSQTFRAIRDLKSAFRLALTGTPIENSITDLWSQMTFLNPGLLGSFTHFVKRFADPIEKQKDASTAEKLQALVKPFLLRRTKEQVAPDLPPRIEQVVYCDMSEEQNSLYESKKSEYRNHIFDSIARQGLEQSKLFVIKGLTELRLLANHPKMLDNSYSDHSGKFEELIERIETVVEQGHKVLVFSQFVKQLKMIAARLMTMKYDFCYFDGTTGTQDRAIEVERFQEDESVRIFLISLKAGGTGLNLTEADYVFLADPWWNPAVEQQAIDRSHRIGQNKTVFSLKFITRNTIEEKIHQLQSKKKLWSDSIITTEESFVKHLTQEDIVVLLN